MNLQPADTDSVAMEAYSRDDHSSSSGSRCSTINVLGREAIFAGVVYIGGSRIN